MKIKSVLSSGLIILSLTGCATMAGQQAKVSENMASTSADSAAKINTNIQAVISASNTDIASITRILYGKTTPTEKELTNTFKELQKTTDSINYAIKTLESFKPSSDQLAHVNQVLSDLQNCNATVSDMQDVLTSGNIKSMRNTLNELKSDITALEQDQQVLFQ